MTFIVNLINGCPNYVSIVFYTVAPQLLDRPDNLTVVEAQGASFSCLATGRPRPEVVWIRLLDMTHLQTQSGLTIEEQESGNRKRRSDLTIMGVQPSDAGVYVCVAMNELGSIMGQATLTIHGELKQSFKIHCNLVNVSCFCFFGSLFLFVLINIVISLVHCTPI